MKEWFRSWERWAIAVSGFALGLIVASFIKTDLFRPTMLFGSLICGVGAVFSNNRLALWMISFLSVAAAIVGFVGFLWKKISWMEVALWGCIFLVASLRNWRSAR